MARVRDAEKANAGTEMTRRVVRMAHDRKPLAPKRFEFSALALNESARPIMNSTNLPN